MLFAGMRPDEAGQLLVTDLVELDGWPCLHVTTFDTLNDIKYESEDRPDDKHLKTPAADRFIPLHPVLIACGFVHFVEAARARGDARIFSDWRKGSDGTYSDTSSKFFNREGGFLERARVKTALTTLYSLRHTFKDAIRRAGLNDHEQDLLMGHASEGVRGIYGSRELYPALIEKFKAVAYEGVDFSPLYDRGGPAEAV
jgi:integrase